MTFIRSDTSLGVGQFRRAERENVKPRDPLSPHLKPARDHAKRRRSVASNDALSEMKPEEMARMAIAVCRSAGDVLGELHAILEQYGPSWYTERLNERAESALQLINGL